MDQTPPNRTHSVEHLAADDSPEDTGTLGYWLTLAGGIAIAVLCFTPLWDEIADPEASGRRSGISHLLAAIGPLPVALAAMAVAGIAAVLGFRARSRNGDGSMRGSKGNS